MKKNVRPAKAQEVRINSGRLRGRKIAFPNLPDLRPTLGRTRETLLNWLRPELADAVCLDLFAGSGVLGIEAASNGAGRVVLVEQQRDTARSLQQSLQQLSLENQCELVNGNALDYLQRCGESFDVIFVDPPFNHPDLLKKAISSICQHKLLRGALYVEYQQGHQALIDETLNANGLTASKTAKAGTTRCVLARKV